MLLKNSIFEVVIESSDAEGFGICRVDGRAVFVSGALAGERWQILILKVTETAVWAKGLKLLEASPDRVPNDCPYPCGGCSLRHTTYPEELRLKRQRVDDCLHRLGGLSASVSAIHPSPSTLRYRNKAVFAVAAVDGKAAFGFYRPRSHDLVPVTDCLLQSERCVRAARAVVDFMNERGIPPYDERTRRGIVRHIFWRESSRDAVLCIVAARGFGADTASLVETLRTLDLTGIVLNVNKSSGNTVLSGDFHTLWGDPCVRETLCGVEFEISPRAFLQVNPPQAEAIYRKVIEYVGHPDRALDLYCGAGTISLCLAKAGIPVTGIEIVPEAIENAKQNAMRNRISNAEFICSDLSREAPGLSGASAVVVDPPRKGLAESVIRGIVRAAPGRVVYVSCNPATLARDLRLFTDLGYELQKAEAFDMFPRTSHVETVCLLTHKD